MEKYIEVEDLHGGKCFIVVSKIAMVAKNDFGGGVEPDPVTIYLDGTGALHTRMKYEDLIEVLKPLI